MKSKNKVPIRVARISKKNLDKLIAAGYVVIISGWGKWQSK